MWNRKLLTCGIAGVLIAGLLVTPVSAHGHHSQIKDTTEVSKICSLCTVKDCTETGYHIHDDEAYCGFDHEQGYCDGSCGVIEVCSVKGCKETGYHTHAKKTYCGYDHSHGYCDGSCDNSCAKQSECETSATKQSRKHHNRHHH